MDIKLKKQAKKTSPLTINIEDEDGKVKTYKYQVRQISNLDIIRASTGDQKAQLGALYNLIEKTEAEPGSPPLTEIVNQMDMSGIGELTEALVNAALKTMPGVE